MSFEKRVTILGGGHGAHTMAADLTLRGFEVTLYEMPRFKAGISQLFETRTIKISGVVEGTAVLHEVTDDIEKAVSGNKYIFLVCPAFAQNDYARLLKGKLTKDQVLICIPGAWGSLLFNHVFEGEEKPIFAETDTLPYDTRLTGPCTVSCFGRNKVGIGFIPANKSGEVMQELYEFFPFHKVYKDALETGIANINPALHSGPCVINLGPIENRATGDFYLYEHGFTPSAARVNIELDNERKKIGEALGYHITALEDFLGMEEGYTWQDMYRCVHGCISLTPICGPNDINNRYLTEDAPYGLVPWSSLAKLLGVDTPVIDSVIHIYNAVHTTDWFERGRTVDEIGLDGMTAEEIKNYVASGKK
ncbi:NAD/NADP octopine/nopaline dehydrogenase family protein [Mediterraneibacter sp. NSJ-55]|uniref:NAD/NADP octopine/nopaline dehydrogenase family protein n=1 Tax=Mediterraneibacter hominis TaxID=2763054 RepID=A0A923LGG3_9FIRM|nr:NAD/NADP-dependent octopine/nopaline dehydrogenase family protein [Mediterraneibacter hominis]MBC5687651.1 NAD/NADP octopine/nopaline dehydrogenase family protein [Mediterraneibacter hominis]